MGFYSPDFDDGSWEYASVYENADYSLVKQSTRQLDYYEVEPQVCERRGDSLFLDFGQETAGYICASATKKKAIP